MGGKGTKIVLLGFSNVYLNWNSEGHQVHAYTLRQFLNNIFAYF